MVNQSMASLVAFVVEKVGRLHAVTEQSLQLLQVCLLSWRLQMEFALSWKCGAITNSQQQTHILWTSFIVYSATECK